MATAFAVTSDERVHRGAPHFLERILIQAGPQDHSERLLSKEWLVKIDNERSIPYLMVRPSYSDPYSTP